MNFSRKIELDNSIRTEISQSFERCSDIGNRHETWDKRFYAILFISVWMCTHIVAAMKWRRQQQQQRHHQISGKQVECLLQTGERSRSDTFPFILSATCLSNSQLLSRLLHHLYAKIDLCFVSPSVPSWLLLPFDRLACGPATHLRSYWYTCSMRCASCVYILLQMCRMYSIRVFDVMCWLQLFLRSRSLSFRFLLDLFNGCF